MSDFAFQFVWNVKISANNIESLVNSLFGVKTFNPFPSFTSSSSSCSGKPCNSSSSSNYYSSINHPW